MENTWQNSIDLILAKAFLYDGVYEHVEEMHKWLLGDDVLIGRTGREAMPLDIIYATLLVHPPKSVLSYFIRQMEDTYVTISHLHTPKGQCVHKLNTEPANRAFRLALTQLGVMNHGNDTKGNTGS